MDDQNYYEQIDKKRRANKERMEEVVNKLEELTKNVDTVAQKEKDREVRR